MSSSYAARNLPKHVVVIGFGMVAHRTVMGLFRF